MTLFHMSPQTQHTQPPYTLLSQLGEGGYGIVWLAKDSTGTLVAIKQPRDAADTSLEYEGAMLRRVHEQGHVQGIPRVLDLTVLEGSETMSLVLDYIDGHPISALTEHSLSVSSVMTIITAFFHIMAHLHRRGIVHADLHNHNILLTGDEQLFLLDFGFARPKEELWEGCFRNEVIDMISLVERWLMWLPSAWTCPRRRNVLSWLKDRRETLYMQTGDDTTAVTFFEEWNRLLQGKLPADVPVALTFVLPLLTDSSLFSTPVFLPISEHVSHI